MMTLPQNSCFSFGVVLLSLLLLSCKRVDSQDLPREGSTKKRGVQLVVLGTAQDAGSPQIGCEKECCKTLFKEPDLSRNVVSLGLIDQTEDKTFLIEATPDIGRQLHLLNSFTRDNSPALPNAILLTHAHMGHYAGLLYLGKESVNAANIPVLAMPKMATYLTNNGPWGQLVADHNIDLIPMTSDKALPLSSAVSVTPFLVPHRDEYSETAGFIIIGPTKKALFIPDIDKWDRWERSISALIATVDYAFIDATFFNAEEINNRDISEIPHPFVIESMDLFHTLPEKERAKIHFIHLNHTNPLFNEESQEYRQLLSNGYRVATFGQVFEL